MSTNTPRNSPGPRIDMDRVARHAARPDAPEETDIDLIANPPPLTPALWNIFVHPLKPRAVSAGGIHIVQDAQTAEQISTSVAKVIAAGPLALQGKTEGGMDLSYFTDKIRTREDLIGKYVMLRRNTGTPYVSKAGYRILSIVVSEIEAITDDPHAWRFYL